MSHWLFIHQTMVAYCRYCPSRAGWALIEDDSLKGFFCDLHQKEADKPLRKESV